MNRTQPTPHLELAYRDRGGRLRLTQPETGSRGLVVVDAGHLCHWAPLPGGSRKETCECDQLEALLDGLLRGGKASQPNTAVVVFPTEMREHLGKAAALAVRLKQFARQMILVSGGNIEARRALLGREVVTEVYRRVTVVAGPVGGLGALLGAPGGQAGEWLRECGHKRPRDPGAVAGAPSPVSPLVTDVVLQGHWECMRRKFDREHEGS